MRTGEPDKVKGIHGNSEGQGDSAAVIFNIQRFSVHDGPGIRTTVFLKGCPLRCQWCANAESMNPSAELGIIRSLCNSCGRCAEVCPEQAITCDSSQSVGFERDKCTACGECVNVCTTDALTIYGKQMTAEEVFGAVCRDRSFYASGGGVTASGGEPLRQAGFVVSLFRRCREAGIGTCLDTSGYADPDTLMEVLGLTDYVLYDIKHMDTDVHRFFTGVPNDVILGNASIVAASAARMLCRVPLVAGVNDSAENMAETARFVKTLGDDMPIELLPYHRLGAAKYQTLDRPYPGESFASPSQEQIESARRIFEERGVSCSIGG